MFLSYFLINCCSFPFLLSQISAGDSSFFRSKGTKRIIKSVQNFMFFSILDRILKFFFETIFKWIWTIKKIISNSHWMIYKLRLFWWDKEKEYPYQTLAPHWFVHFDGPSKLMDFFHCALASAVLIPSHASHNILQGRASRPFSV
jgi:hypothetical protein